MTLPLSFLSWTPEPIPAPDGSEIAVGKCAQYDICGMVLQLHILPAGWFCKWCFLWLISGMVSNAVTSSTARTMQIVVVIDQWHGVNAVTSSTARTMHESFPSHPVCGELQS